MLDPLFPEYTITELIGRGGMGAVYRGVQKSLDRPVAIKVLPPELANADPSFAARFEREAKSMARLDHPNIVHVFDFGRTHAGHWFIVMEFINGVDFHQLIRSGELDAASALTAVSQICDALEYAHGMGYIHRDIKPDNIFIDRKGKLKVGDFGLAKLIGGEASEETNTEFNQTLTVTGAGMGTPAYCAPEQIEGRSTDHRADIYSLGVMFYEMLTRELPRGNFQPPSQKVNVDVRIDEVVLRAMESERERRYSSAGEMRTELEAARTVPPSLPTGNFETKTTQTDNPTMNTQSSMTTTTAPHIAPPASMSKSDKAKAYGKTGLTFLIIAFLIPVAVTLLFVFSEDPRSLEWLPKVAIVLVVLSLVFSLIFGIFGWAHPTGKIATITSTCLLILGVLATLLLTPLAPVRGPQSNGFEPDLGPGKTSRPVSR